EGLENAVRTCEVQAWARVPNGNEHAARSFRLRTDQQFARLRCEIAHRLGCVHDQIEDYLLQLDAIAVHGRQARRELCLQRDTMPQHFASAQGDDSEDGFIQAESAALGWRLLDERPDS